MMAEFEGAADTVESPTATESSSPAPSQATSAPAPLGANGTPPDPSAQVPFHQHPRWQQVIRELQGNRQIVAQMPELQRQLKEATEKLASFERKQSQGTATPEEAMQMQMAAQALERLLMSDSSMLDRVLMSHPKLKALAENADRIIGLQGGVSQMQQQQGQALVRQATSHIHGLAKEAGQIGRAHV